MLVEAREACSGASGRNAGHCRPGESDHAVRYSDGKSRARGECETAYGVGGVCSLEGRVQAPKPERAQLELSRIMPALSSALCLPTITSPLTDKGTLCLSS